MKQLDPKAVWFFFIGFVLRWFFVAIFFTFWAGSFIAAFFSADSEGTTEFSLSSILSWLWLIVPLFLIVCYLWARLAYKFYRYELVDHGFRKESGVIYKRYVTIPYDRIQNVDIYRGIWARFLGLSDLQIQTAGSSAVMSSSSSLGMGAEGRLPAISKEEAERLRDELINRARQSKNQGL